MSTSKPVEVGTARLFLTPPLSRLAVVTHTAVTMLLVACPDQAPPQHTGALGEPCRSSGACDRGLVCKANRCIPTYGYGDPAAGDAVGGDSSPGDVSPGDNASGDPTGGDSAAGDSPGGDAACGPGMLINEFVANPTGGDSGFEWIELLNSSCAAIDLTGWEIRRGKSSGETVRFTIPSGMAALPPGGYLVVGDDQVAGADLVSSPTLDLGNGTGGDIVSLFDAAQQRVDSVVYGGTNTDVWVDDTGGIATSIAAVPASGSSLARLPNGVDTNASGDDFSLAGTPTMGAPND